MTPILKRMHSKQISTTGTKSTIQRSKESTPLLSSKDKMVEDSPMIGNLSYVYFVEKGNNSKIIRRVLAKRSWLAESKSYSRYQFEVKKSNVHLYWKPVSSGFNWQLLGRNKFVFNHYECHRELTTKQRLNDNIKRYCKSHGIDFNKFIPSTYIVHIDRDSLMEDLRRFINAFDSSIWIMKPPDLNRGQGIRLLNSLDFALRAINTFATFPTMDPNKSKARSKTVYVKTETTSFAVDVESVPHQKERIVIF